MDFQKEFKKVLLSPPHCILGKSGITNQFISNVARLLKRYKVIKIKALKTIATKTNIKDLAIEISQLTNSHLLDIRGRVFILSRYSPKKSN
jgi:RNA-binding protein YhbY